MDQERNNLAAPCGLYCGACSIYVAGKRGDSKRLEQMVSGLSQYAGRELEIKDLACEGCSSEIVALHCRDCAIRYCAIEKGCSHCAQCSVFPCKLINDFNNDGMLHHGEVLNNIKRQREIGIDAWIEEQEERWHCTKCNCAVDWYSDQCPGCGSPIALKWH